MNIYLDRVSDKLIEGGVVGWFQGRSGVWSKSVGS